MGAVLSRVLSQHTPGSSAVLMGTPEVLPAHGWWGKQQWERLTPVGSRQEGKWGRVPQPVAQAKPGRMGDGQGGWGMGKEDGGQRTRDRQHPHSQPSSYRDRVRFNL